MFRRPSRRPFLRPRSDSGVEIIRIPKRSSGRITADTNAASADKPAALFTCESACVRSDTRATVLEGCSIQCASRLLHDLLPKVDLEVIPVDQFYKLEGNPFGLEDIKPAKQAKIIEQAARGILDALKRDGSGSV
jgi:hypothetical protein